MYQVYQFLPGCAEVHFRVRFEGMNFANYGKIPALACVRRS